MCLSAPDVPDLPEPPPPPPPPPAPTATTPPRRSAAARERSRSTSLGTGQFRIPLGQVNLPT